MIPRLACLTIATLTLDGCDRPSGLRVNPANPVPELRPWPGTGRPAVKSPSPKRPGKRFWLMIGAAVLALGLQGCTASLQWLVPTEHGEVAIGASWSPKAGTLPATKGFSK